MPAKLRVEYTSGDTALQGLRIPLGVVGFGKAPFGATPATIWNALAPASGGDVLEVWYTTDEVEQISIGRVTGAVSESYAFGAIEILDEAGSGLESGIEAAYRELLLFLNQAGKQPVRFWNYLSNITGEQDGMERYWRFNIGRQRAFQSLLTQPVPPVATCIGCKAGRSTIYVLAAKESAHAVENPRQISAYAYPDRYGPVSPSFSRAARHSVEGNDTLFISGTASIVGHETRHVSDFDAQMAETLENLRLMMDLTERDAAGEGRWAVKTYLRDPANMMKLDTALAACLPAGSQRLHLVGDICRKELLLEIEAVRCTV